MKPFIHLFFLLFSFVTIAQENNTLRSILDSYEAFNYVDAIRKSEQALLDKQSFNSEDLMQIYLIKGISHFSISEDKKAEECFIEILNLKNDYSPNPNIVSPKIISEFNRLKTEFISNPIIQIPDSQNYSDSLYSLKLSAVESKNEVFKEALAKSIVLPGWGHFNVNQVTKGWILSSLSLATLTTMIYFIIDTNSKEKKYLNETNEELIKERYSSYNTSYKIRNFTIALYSTLWTYSLVDLLFFINIVSPLETENDFSTNPPSDLRINFQFNF